MLLKLKFHRIVHILDAEELEGLITRLWRCCATGDVIPAKKVIRVAEADVNRRVGTKGKNALFVAAEKGHQEILSELLNRPKVSGFPAVELELADRYGRSALNVAALRGNHKCVASLLEKGAQVDSQGEMLNYGIVIYLSEA